MACFQNHRKILGQGQECGLYHCCHRQHGLTKGCCVGRWVFTMAADTVECSVSVDVGFKTVHFLLVTVHCDLSLTASSSEKNNCNFKCRFTKRVIF